MQLQKNVVATLLWKPSLIKTRTVEPEWFKYKTYAELIKLLNATSGDESDPVALYEHLKDINPMTVSSFESIYELQADGFMGQNLDKNIKLLKIRYYKELLEKTTVRYNNEPNEKNYLAMKDRMRDIEQLDEPEDDGNILTVMDEIKYELENEVEDGIKFYSQFDRILGGGLQKGELMIVAARPAVGKSAYAINLAIEAALKNKDMTIDFFTLEMTKKQMVKRFLSRKTEINSYKLRNPSLKLNDGEKQVVRTEGDLLANGRLRIFDKERKIGDISKIIRRRSYENKDKNYLVIVDYLGLVRSSERKTDQREVVDEVSRGLKELTTDLNIPIIALSQLNRGLENRTKDEKKPKLSDLRDSGSIEQDANIVAFLWEPNADKQDEEQYTELVIAKSREGMTGDLKYRFIKSKMYFEEVI